jgi:hypothetical protein
MDAPLWFIDDDIGIIRLVVDMDGDALEDLVWVDEDSIQVWFSNGDGAFTRGPLVIPDVTLSLAEHNPRTYPRAGDVNGDAIVDLIFGIDNPYPDGQVAVFFGLGGGSFSSSHLIVPPPPTYTFSGNIEHVALGDVDGDGVLEIAEAHATSTGGLVVDTRADVTWWDWNGSTFVPSTPLVLQGDLSCVTGLTSLDVNGDSFADLAVSGTNCSSNFTNLVKFLPTVDGDATLGAVHSVSGSVSELVAADLDGDGDDDLLASHRSNCSQLNLSVWERQASSFVRTDSSALAVDEQSCAWWPHPVLGDWDGDGDLDLYEGQWNLNIYQNDGSNSFVHLGSNEHEKDDDFYGYPPGSADFDQDGFIDFVGPRAIFFGDGGMPKHAPAPTSSFLHDFVASDWEGDGDLDLLIEDGDIAVNDATGNFTVLQNRFPTPPSGFSYTTATALHDFTGDGRLDYLVRYFEGVYPNFVFRGMNLLADDGLGGYVDLGTVSSAQQLYVYSDGALRRGVDIDQDQDEDLIYQGGFYLNDNPQMDTFVSYFAATEIADVADLDDDQDPDVLSLFDDGSTATYSLQRNQGNLVFTAETLVTAASAELGVHARFLDLDDDQDLDVVIPSDGNTAAYVLENVGGALQPAQALDGGFGYTEVVARGDVDQDGLTDLICNRRCISNWCPNNSFQVHRRSGPGLTYEAHRDWMIDDLQAVGDLDEDGDPDGIGAQLVVNRRRQGDADGRIRQYGSGGVGLGGAVPVLGASGPLKPGSTTASLRVKRARGGSFGFLIVGLLETDAPGFAGTSLYVLPPLTLVPFGLSGTPDAPGEGEFEFSLNSVLTTVAGLNVFHQYVLVDSAASSGSLIATGGLELQYGQP